MRTANLLIGVGKGGNEDIAGKIIQKHNKNVMSTTLVLGNPQVNLSADVYYKNSTELHNLLEDIKSMPNVNYIEWYEVVSRLKIIKAVDRYLAACSFVLSVILKEGLNFLFFIFRCL